MLDEMRYWAEIEKRGFGVSIHAISQYCLAQQRWDRAENRLQKAMKKIKVWF